MVQKLFVKTLCHQHMSMSEAHGKPKRLYIPRKMGSYKSLSFLGILGACEQLTYFSSLAINLVRQQHNGFAVVLVIWHWKQNVVHGNQAHGFPKVACGMVLF